MSSKLDILGSVGWWGGESELGSVALKERGLVKEVDSNKEMLLKRGTGGGVVEGVEDGPEEARITKLPHGVHKQKSLFKTSLP
jgi:hypothetical protein